MSNQQANPADTQPPATPLAARVALEVVGTLEPASARDPQHMTRMSKLDGVLKNFQLSTTGSRRAAELKQASRVPLDLMVHGTLVDLFVPPTPAALSAAAAAAAAAHSVSMYGRSSWGGGL